MFIEELPKSRLQFMLGAFILFDRFQRFVFQTIFAEIDGSLFLVENDPLFCFIILMSDCQHATW